MRTELLAKTKNIYFRNANMNRLNRQFCDIPAYKFLKKTSRTPPVYRILKRNQIIELIYITIERLTINE